MASPLNLTNLSPNDVGIPSVSGTNRTYRVLSGRGIRSLFSNGVGQFSPFPKGVDPESGNVTGISGAADVHKDELYDLSISGIINYCKDFSSMKLDFADFAYLKNVGVYPNNRIIIARRFSGGVGNDLTAIKSSPLATLISWVSEEEDFLSVKYNEEWTAAEADFEKVLNDIGEDVKASQDQGSGLGSLAKRAFDIIPLPGFSEGLQYEVKKRMGLTDAGIGNSPLGNPNIIAEAMRRKTIDFSSGDSGLVAKFSVKMTVEYEQKFINGVDPTLVYMDIIQNALTFGTSDSAFKYSSAFGSGVTGIIRDLISGNIGAIFKALSGFVSSLLSAISDLALKFANLLINAEAQDVQDTFSADAIANFLKVAFASTIGHVVSKYKIRLMGIANALTGSPSTPWHITIGNPRKPVFSSGDMLCTDVTLTLGKVLAFNDLPSSIKLDLNFTSGRNLGAQEIFNRLNTGKGRSYVRLEKSFVESPDAKFATSSDIDSLYVSSSASSYPVTPIIVQDLNDPYILPWSGDTQQTDYLLYDIPQALPNQNQDNTNPSVGNTGSNNLSNQSAGTPGPEGVNVQTTGTASTAGGATPSTPPQAQVQWTPGLDSNGVLQVGQTSDQKKSGTTDNVPPISWEVQRTEVENEYEIFVDGVSKAKSKFANGLKAQNRALDYVRAEYTKRRSEARRRR